MNSGPNCFFSEKYRAGFEKYNDTAAIWNKAGDTIYPGFRQEFIVLKVNKDKADSNILLSISFFLFLLPFIYRIFIGYISVKPHFDAPFEIILTILKHDLLIFSLLLIFYAISSLFEKSYLKISCRLAMYLILFLYCLDLVIFEIFTTRLSFSDVFQYAGDIGFLRSFFKDSFLFILLALLVAFIFLSTSVQFLTHDGPKNKRTLLTLAATALVMAGLYFHDRTDKYFIHNWVFANFMEINAGRGLDEPYSNKFKTEVMKAGIKDEKICMPKNTGHSRKNIIVLMLESFSMYHSKFFSGINDCTPNLDRIAAEGRAFTNFFSNGFTTEHALISIFTGKIPFPNMKESKYNFISDSFNGYYNLESTLPAILAEQGYHSEFLTTGNLEFSNKGEWLDNIGFDYVEGHDASFYDNYKRFHFSAAPDDAFYKRVLDRIENHIRQTPYFIAIETVSTHLPFIDPISGKRSESLAVQFADKSLGEFYNNLKDNNFFQSGLLIIVSDHRSMTLISKKEIEKFGEKAPALVPMIICGERFGGVEKEQFQQTDIFNSIANFVTENVCTAKFDGDFLFSPSIPPEYSLYVRGDDRSLINVFSKDNTGTIKLEGDKTAFISGHFKNAINVVKKINFERLARK